MRPAHGLARLHGLARPAGMVLAACAAAGSASPGIQPTATPRYSYSVVHVFPHDPLAFTQGLEYVDGFLYEGTGLNGRSSVRKVKLETGEVLQHRDLAPEYFGEGITIWKSNLIELTWQSHVGFVYDRASFSPARTFSYTGEGWGLTHDDRSLIMSDGSASLRFLDPATFAEKRRVQVTDAGAPVVELNELEYVKGEVLANVWKTHLIARIAPESGRVLGWIDLRGLLPAGDASGADVLNGIAYDAAHDRLFVTGKLWPKLFEIKIK
jgi:glutaminyl-peptide cyclotransferase